jgi:hypothetical protein
MQILDGLDEMGLPKNEIDFLRLFDFDRLQLHDFLQFKKETALVSL